MGPLGLLRWQWRGYAGYHRDRSNLLTHIFVVPVFWLGTLALILAATKFSWALLLSGVGCIGASVVMQGKGHKLEATPPAPFTSPWNFIGRILLEQFINFPRFVLTGGWRRNLTDAR